MISKARARELVDQMVNEYFVELRSEKIVLDFSSGNDFYMAFIWVMNCQLSIDKDARKLSELAFNGCLAHELAHMAQLAPMSIFKRLASHLKTSKKSLTKEERRTDEEVINRGLGNALLAFNREHNKVYEAYKPSEALTVKEIKQRLKQRRRGRSKGL